MTHSAASEHQVRMLIDVQSRRLHSRVSTPLTRRPPDVVHRLVTPEELPEPLIQARQMEQRSEVKLVHDAEHEFQRQVEDARDGGSLVGRFGRRRRAPLLCGWRCGRLRVFHVSASCQQASRSGAPCSSPSSSPSEPQASPAEMELSRAARALIAD